MNNTWIVVPITKNDVDLTSFVEKLSGEYIAPDTYEKYTYDNEILNFKYKTTTHPYAGQTGPNFTDKIVFVNMRENYKEYPGIKHIESFGEINIPRLMNVGIEYAISKNADNIIVLSNPCNFDPFIIEEALDLVNDNKIVNVADGVFFILPGSTKLRLDENFKIWFWAEDIYKQADNSTVKYNNTLMDISELIPFNIDRYELQTITEEDKINFNNKWS